MADNLIDYLTKYGKKYDDWMKEVKDQNIIMAENRLEICKQCESYFEKIMLCKECHCFMPLKTLLPRVKCPLSKW